MGVSKLGNHTIDINRQPLPVPIEVLNGTHDPGTTEDQVAGWRQETEFRLHRIEGDHFFIHSATERILSIIGECHP